MPVFDAVFKGKIYLPEIWGGPILPTDPPIIEPPPVDPPPGDDTVLKSSDLTYLGSYVPDADNEGTRNWAYYSWGIPSFRWINGTKYMYLRGPSEKINGWPSWPSLVLWRVPEPKKDGPASCQIAQMWQGHIAGGQAGTYDTGIMAAYGEAAIMYPIAWNEEMQLLMWQYSGIYNGNYSNPVLGYSELKADGTVTPFGPWRCDLHSKKVHSSLVPIPKSFQSFVNGLKWAVGGKTHTQMAGGNVGAGLHCINLPDPTAKPDAVYPDQHASYHGLSLLDYDMTNPQPRPESAGYDLCNWHCALPNPPGGCQGIYDSAHGGPVTKGMPYFSGSKPAASSCVDWLEGFTWIETPAKRGILYVGQANLSPKDGERKHNWYGANPCAHGQTDASWEATGPGGGNVCTIGQIFDPNDLRPVARRTKSPIDVLPKEEFLLNSICPETGEQAGCTSAISGAVFDPVDNTLTIIQRIGFAKNYTAMPRFFVFKVPA